MTTKPKATEVKEQSAEQVKAAITKPEIKASNTKAQNHIAQWTLYHDGKRYVAGDELELDTDTAQPLVDAGVLVALK